MNTLSMKLLGEIVKSPRCVPECVKGFETNSAKRLGNIDAIWRDGLLDAAGRIDPNCRRQRLRIASNLKILVKMPKQAE